MFSLCDVGGTRPASHYAMVGKRRVHYLEIGAYEAQPAIVLVHGGGGGGANWYRMFGPLSARHRVLAPDLPGFGLSDPVKLTRPLGEQTARHLRDWMDAIGLDRAILIGTSFGGLAALRFAQHFPGRVAKLVLIDSAGGGNGVPNVLYDANLFFAPYVYRPSRWDTRRMLRRFLVNRPLPEAEENALVEYMFLSAKRAGGKYIVRGVQKFLTKDGQAEQPTMIELKAVTAPTLIVWGEKDKFFPVSHATALAMRIAGSKTLIIPDAGHSPNWDAPAALAAAILEFVG